MFIPYSSLEIPAICKSNLTPLHTGYCKVSWYTHFYAHKGNISTVPTELCLRDLRLPPRCSWILRSPWISWPLNMGPIGCLETSVRKYHYTLSNIPEGRRSSLRFLNSSFPHTLSHFLIIKLTRCTNFSNLFLLASRIRTELQFRSDPARKLSANLYDKYHCSVYSEELQRNCQKYVEFYSKNKFEKLVHLKKNVKWSRYRPGVAQRVGRGIALLSHDCGTRRG